jgi:hypothetical protein
MCGLRMHAAGGDLESAETAETKDTAGEREGLNRESLRRRPGLEGNPSGLGPEDAPRAHPVRDEARIFDRQWFEPHLR